MQVRWLVLLLLALAHVPTVMAEDDASVRDLAKKINETLEQIKNALYDISDGVSSSTVDKINNSIEYAKQVNSAAKSLAEKHPSDEPAKTIAEKYPDYSDRFTRSATALLEMKREHVRLHESGLLRRCEDAERQLKEEAAKYIDRNDPEGTQKVPEQAERLGAPIVRELADYDGKKSNVSNWKSTARDFSESHGEWADVRSRMSDSAERIYSRWERLLEEVHRACDELAKQKQHQEVLRVLQKLSQSTEAREQLYRELDENLERIARLAGSLQDRSNDSDATSAVSLADSLSSLLSKLTNAKGSDSKANSIAEKWPGYVNSYRDSMLALKRLKQFQKTLDLGVEECSDWTQEIRSIVKSDATGSGVRAKQIIQERATFLRPPILKADNAKAEIQNLRGRVQSFIVDDGKWKDARHAMHESAAAIASYWESQLRKIHEKCDDLVLGLNSNLMAKGNGMFYSKEDNLISDCTEKEQRPLQGDVNTKCKGPGEKKCDNLRVPQDCTEIRRRYDLTQPCIDSRNLILVKCFTHNVNTGHKTQINQTITMQSNCKIKLDRCPS